MLSNYPDGLSDSTVGAPWNDPVIPEKEFDVTCSQTLSKTVSVWTNNYVPGAEGVDYEPDDEGGCYAVGWHDPDDTSDTDWAEEYSSQHKTPKELIKYLQDFITHALQKTELPYKESFLKDLLQECKGWTVDECEVIEDGE